MGLMVQRWLKLFYVKNIQVLWTNNDTVFDCYEALLVYHNFPKKNSV